jgi:hypothetical protein
MYGFFRLFYSVFCKGIRKVGLNFIPSGGLSQIVISSYEGRLVCEALNTRPDRRRPVSGTRIAAKQKQYYLAVPLL